MITAEFSSARRVRVVVATTVLLSFISFWRAAAIILNNLRAKCPFPLGAAVARFYDLEISQLSS